MLFLKLNPKINEMRIYKSLIIFFFLNEDIKNFTKLKLETEKIILRKLFKNSILEFDFLY